MKKVQITVTYLIEYSEDELKEGFNDLNTDEEFERAAKVMFFDENMDNYEPNDIEIEVVND